MRNLFLVILGIFFLGMSPTIVRAETPGHNPDLDSQCGVGFQWSRMTVACEQANCPPGARRNYTLECNCGEAWNEPFTSCFEITGMVSHCVPKGVDCDLVKPGFDILTGECKYLEGFEWNKDKTDCVKKFPSEISCSVVDLDGNPVTNVDLRFGEYGDNRKILNSSKVKTDGNGSATFKIKNSNAASIKLIFANQQGYYKSDVQLTSDSDLAKCTVTVFNNQQLESKIKSEMKAFLKDACLDPELLKKVDAAVFEFDASVSTSQYDPETKQMRINSAELNSGWDDLSRTLFHEFNHYISDQIIDPSSLYVKGYPLLGKYAGGKHNNWDATKSTGTYPFDVDGAELAFEEGLADFLSMLYFKSKGEVYQGNLMTDKKALETLQNLKNPEDIKRVEGAISSFLWEFYQGQIEASDKGPSLAAGDLIRAITYDKRNAWTIGFPARDINEFIASKIKSDNNESPTTCTPKTGETKDINTLATKYGFIGSNQPKIKIVPLDKSKLPEIRTQLDQMGLSDMNTLHNMIPEANRTYEFPEDLGNVVIQTFPTNYQESGEVQTIKFDAETLNMFSIDPQGQVTVEKGKVEVEDTSVSTLQVIVNNDGTKYSVEAAEDDVDIVVREGNVTVISVEDTSKTATVESGFAINYTDGLDFSEVRSVEFEDNKDVNGDNSTRDDGFSFIFVFVISLCCGFFVLLVIVGIFLMLKRKK